MLYKIIEEYAALGAHRTGTSVDYATADWFASHLQSRGAKVSHQDYTFDLFDAHTIVTLDGREILSMPLYYEAVGDVKTDKVAVAEFGDGEHGRGLDGALETMINDAMSQGYEALVIATLGETGNLVAINCEPVLRNRIPVMLVPGRYARALNSSAVTVEYSASLKPGHSSNVIGHWGKHSTEPPFVITTPLSGWFTCAGERGTGLAVALHVAEQLSKHMPFVPLEVIAPSGHELGFYGAYQMIETFSTPPLGVLHLGSCIAACDGKMQGIVHASTTVCDAVKESLEPLRIRCRQPEYHQNPDCWVGESQCWAKLGMPMLSVAGLSPLFHTPEDIAENATTPELLEHTAFCMTNAALTLIKDCGSDRRHRA